MCVQAHKLLTRDEEQVLSKYIVEMRPYEAQLDILMQGGQDQPPDEVTHHTSLGSVWAVELSSYLLNGPAIRRMWKSTERPAGPEQ